jgi:hypothetical protein
MQFASSKLCIAVKTTLYQSFSSALQVRIYASSKLCIVVKTTLYQSILFCFAGADLGMQFANYNLCIALGGHPVSLYILNSSVFSD